MNPKEIFRSYRADALLLITSILVATAYGYAHQPAPKSLQPGTAAAAAPEPKYKGIWEPVNYPDDVNLDSVYFVNDKVGWASGKGHGGIILHTNDGGEHWELQLGDPNSNEGVFKQLSFLDQTHGWAVQNDEKLVRTSDGTNWLDAGVFPKSVPTVKYLFTSPENGFHLGGFYNTSQINVTQDGGRSWKEVFRCVTTLQVQGLTKKVNCFLEDFHFPTARVGYAVGGGFNGGYFVVAKTEDGGITWKLVFATTDMETADAVFFTDETHGVIRLRDRRVFVTSDGGQSWNGIPASASGALLFADPEVGASCAGKSCTFTSDGGQHWVSRNFQFPAPVVGFSVPRRDRIYVVGEHGMVYRYRIVPTDYMAKGALDAPLLSPYGGTINAQLDHIRTEVQQLQTKIGSSPSATDSAPAPTQQNSSFQAAASPTKQPRNQASPAQSSFVSGTSGTYADQGSGTNGGFSQDAASPATSGNSQNTSGGGFSQDATAGGGFSQDTGFSQDVLSSPPSQPVQNCCGPQIQTLQTDLNTFSQQVPTFTGKYRNLNLLFVGINMFADLMGKARGMRESFLSLKKAPNLQAASIALQDLAAKLDNTSQAVTSGFQNLSAGGAVQGISGRVGNMLANPDSMGSKSDPNAKATQNPSQQKQDTSQQKKEEKKTSVEDLKKKLKRKIPF